LAQFGLPWRNIICTLAALSRSPYVHAFENTVNGVNSIPASFGGGNANLLMYRNSITIGFGWNRNGK
jgi:hypothetical protein